LDAPDESGWMFDSGRDYLDQIAVYKAFKGEEMAKAEKNQGVCEVCGRSLEGKRLDARTCSKNCKVTACRRRKGAKEK
jgi:hypothetical protein